MLYTNKELKEIYGGTYQINRAIEEKKIFKIQKGLYSDKEIVHYLEVITKLYPEAIITSKTAYYFHNLTDVIPTKIDLAMIRDSYKKVIKNVNRIAVIPELFLLGKEQIEYEGVTINIYNKERLLIELVRNKSILPYDYYKEIINNYRLISESLNIEKIEDYIFKFPNSEKLLDIIQNEVF